MPLRLYLDENRGERRLTRALLASRIHVVRFADVGMAGADDDVQLDYAADHNLTLYSGDLKDFPRLHWEWLATGRTHAGIIVVPFGTPVGVQLRALLAINGALLDNEELGMELVRLSAWFD